MKAKLQDASEEFLNYLFDVRGYSETSIVTYEIALRQMLEESHVYEENGLTVLDITPFRFKIVKNHKKTIVKKLSAIHSFVKYLEDQCHMHINRAVTGFHLDRLAVLGVCQRLVAIIRTKNSHRLVVGAGSFA